MNAECPQIHMGEPWVLVPGTASNGFSIEGAESNFQTVQIPQLFYGRTSHTELPSSLTNCINEYMLEYSTLALAAHRLAFLMEDRQLSPQTLMLHSQSVPIGLMYALIKPVRNIFMLSSPLEPMPWTTLVTRFTRETLKTLKNRVEHNEPYSIQDFMSKILGSAKTLIPISQEIARFDLEQMLRLHQHIIDVASEEYKQRGDNMESYITESQKDGLQALAQRNIVLIQGSGDGIFRIDPRNPVELSFVQELKNIHAVIVKGNHSEACWNLPFDFEQMLNNISSD